MIDPVIDARYQQIRELFAVLGENATLDDPIQKWVDGNDRHLPQLILNDSLRELLAPSRWIEICETPGIGTGRLSKLLDVLERPIRLLRSSAADRIDERTQPIVHEESEDFRWRRAAENIRLHRLDGYPLGRFARSLLELPSSLWDWSLGKVINRSTFELQEMPGNGPARVRQIIRIISEIDDSLAQQSSTSHLYGRLLTANLHRVAVWIENILAAKAIPDKEALVSSFVEPLLEQFALDLGPDESDLIRRRWGMDCESATLEELGQELELTRERIRQITSRVTSVMDIRWAEGRHLLADFYELLLGGSESGPQLAMCRTILDACYEVRVSKKGSRQDVLAAWSQAGRDRLTPMRDDELSSWLASSFPQQNLDRVREWLEQAGLSLKHDSEMLFFSNELMDRLLMSLYLRSEPMPLTEACSLVEIDEKALNGRIERDLRFVEDEEKCIQASQLYSITRRDGMWQVDLRISPTRRCERIALPNLVNMVVIGLLEHGVADATVWGVHRFLNERLNRIHGSELVDDVSPFILGDQLVRHSDGLNCHMRRRRLRWDTADGSIPVRGKRGWVEFVVRKIGVPHLLDELKIELQRRFQDYEDYVFRQLRFDDEDDDTQELSFRTTAGNSTRVPRLFVPNDWSLDASVVNVSEGVKKFVDRIISCPPERAFSKSELEHIPWVIELCDRENNGRMMWND
jgi:hypothetical protein